MEQSIYKQALWVTSIVGLALFVINYIVGTDSFFLILNGDLGNVADRIFPCITYLGDGVMWVPLALYVIFNRKDKIVLVLTAIIISTLITHLFKNILIPNEPRPFKEISDYSLIHTVKNVSLHSIGSFPSGHTTTAFSIYLILCILFNNKRVAIGGFIIALLVGYSRIYLAQHFPRDIAGGMIAAVITLLLSVMAQKRLFKGRKMPFTP